MSVPELYSQISRWLQSPAYEQAKERISRENNQATQSYGKGFAHMSAPLPPSNAQKIDYSAFKNSPAEKDKKAEAKAYHRAQLQAHYGPRWKSHLNIPGRELAMIKLQF
jgi:hypothetical protein